MHQDRQELESLSRGPEMRHHEAVLLPNIRFLHPILHHAPQGTVLHSHGLRKQQELLYFHNSYRGLFLAAVTVFFCSYEFEKIQL